MRVAVLFGHLYRTIFPVFDCQHGIEEYRGWLDVVLSYPIAHQNCLLNCILGFRLFLLVLSGTQNKV